MSESKNDHTCRICFEAEATDANPLLRPCLCKGHMELVHAQCWQGCRAACTVCKFPDEETKKSQFWHEFQKGVSIRTRCDGDSGWSHLFYLPILALSTTADYFIVGSRTVCWILGVGYTLFWVVVVLTNRQFFSNLVRSWWSNLKLRMQRWI